MQDLFLDDWEPVENEELDIKSFSEPIRGKYIVEVEGLEFKEIESKKDGKKYELISMKLKVAEDVSGDISMNRFLDKAYFLGTSEWNDDPLAGFKRLLNDLKSVGLYDETMKQEPTVISISQIEEKVKGSKFQVTAFPKKDKQEVRIYAVKEDSGLPV